jgi:type IV secretory pathway VirB10-like protein
LQGKNTDLRITEAAKIGFHRIIVPHGKNIEALKAKVDEVGTVGVGGKAKVKVALFPCKSLKEALGLGLDLSNYGRSIDGLLGEQGKKGQRKRNRLESIYVTTCIYTPPISIHYLYLYTPCMYFVPYT